MSYCVILLPSKVLSLSLATEEDLRIDPGWCSGVTSVTFTGVFEGELPVVDLTDVDVCSLLSGVVLFELAEGTGTGSAETRN